MARDRLPPGTFDLPVEKLRSGYYSDAYFNFARSRFLADGRHPHVLMQVFQKNHAILGGIDEAIAVVKLASHDWDALEVRALHDGDAIEPWETVLTIEGDYTLFAHLETVYLGVLARRTLVSTNVRRVVDAAAPKSILFFPARHDTGSCRPATAMRRTSRARSASRRTRSRRGGAVAGSARFRTRSSPRTAATPSPRRSISPTGRRRT